LQSPYPPQAVALSRLSRARSVIARREEPKGGKPREADRTKRAIATRGFQPYVKILGERPADRAAAEE
jgi:hypothetical protein